MYELTGVWLVPEHGGRGGVADEHQSTRPLADGAG